MARVQPPFVVAFCLIAGCAAPEVTEQSIPLEEAPAIPGINVTILSFTVDSQGTARTVAATHYAALTQASTVVLAIHGSAGIRENNWGAQPVPGYSLGQRVAQNGSDFVAIDLLGYGDSEEAGITATIEDYADIVGQISTALKVDHGYGYVIGLGHSMGGLIVDVAQGNYESFDAIAVTGWAHSGFSDELLACVAGTSTCPGQQDEFFQVDNMDLRVLDSMMASFEGNPMEVDGNFYWGARAGGASGVSLQDTTTPTATVPVLVMLGEQDWYWNQRDYGSEADYYPAASSFEFHVVPAAGHFLFHHLNHADAHAVFMDWQASLQ